MTDVLLEDRPQLADEADAPPMLRNGDHLDQPTFHELYAAMPEGCRAELVEGVVILNSSVSAEHGVNHPIIATWLSLYSFATQGTRAYIDSTFILGPWNEMQPDVSLIVLPEHGGLARIEGKYFAGPPEFVAEVAYSSAAYDRHSKRRSYEVAGVREYLILNLRDKKVEWHILRDGKFAEMAPSGDDLLRSETFPGLWLNPSALIARDGPAIVQALQLGLASPEHAAFAAQLLARKTP